MAPDYTAPGLPLTGDEVLQLSQWDPLKRVWRRRRVTLRDVLAVLQAGQAVRDAAQDAALTAEVAARQGADAAEAASRAGADTGLAARATAIEARPEEVAHFTASRALPAITALLPVTLLLTGLVPARAGDVLRAGESITVTPSAPLPAGVNIAAATVPTDGVVAVQLTTGLSVAAGASPLTWSIAAGR